MIHVRLLITKHQKHKNYKPFKSKLTSLIEILPKSKHDLLSFERFLHVIASYLKFYSILKLLISFVLESIKFIQHHLSVIFVVPSIRLISSSCPLNIFKPTVECKV